jgi:hypothetical protein
VVRNVLAILAVIIAAVVLINLLYTSDRERVEDEMLRLFEVARSGGDDAVLEILDAFASDYRGSGYFSLSSIERHLRKTIVPAGKLKKLTHGSIDAIVKGSEIVIPTVSIKADYGGYPVNGVFAITWAKRAGDWKIVDVRRWQFGD